SEMVQMLMAQTPKDDIRVDFKQPSNSSVWISIIPTVMIMVLFFVFFFMMSQQSQGGGGGRGVMNFGKSRAKVMPPDAKRVTFNDVAGADEEKQELEEIVDFLKQPSRYTEMGARIPKGVLLVGPPGTGKTLLAKAIAGEAGVPFYSISGSDFVEMFVGVGASRVRDLFEQAKKSAPSLVFIDEIDAVGRQRGAGLGGGHDEREQTLNQLLVEMDGFGANEGIIMIAATNRPDILDPALLRPGRFDRQIVVGAPDVKGREEILKVHTKKKPLSEEVELKVLAKRTPGFSGADLENLANEAALLAVRKNEKLIGMQDFEEAITRVIAGPEKKSRAINEHDRKLTAYHEAGHAVVMKLLVHSDPVHEISIIPRGMAGGYTMHLPEEDRSYTSKEKLRDDMVGLLGGRVAEKLILSDISTGAKNDIDRASAIARAMVMEYGMSEKLGTISYGGDNNEVFLGRNLGHGRNFSEEVGAEIDKEVKRFIDEAYERAETLLSQNINKLHAVAATLLEKEKIDGAEFVRIFEAS
ncbi:MAG: ATP-dependent zinc metalloprotease FtsH, partial [Clostridium sp.]|nr:ATP-dependent zinc metalloprotease FtsH [Clostridium sp.]